MKRSPDGKYGSESTQKHCSAPAGIRTQNANVIYFDSVSLGCVQSDADSKGHPIFAGFVAGIMMGMRRGLYLHLFSHLEQTSPAVLKKPQVSFTTKPTLDLPYIG